MANRVRYMSSSAINRKDLRKGCEALCKKEYEDNLAWGFIDTRNEGDFVTSVFVERYETEDEIVDPFGKVTSYKRIQFTQTNFRIGLTEPQLEIYDYPRSIAPLLTELSTAFGQIAFASIQVELQALIKLLRKKTSSLALNSATLKDISLSSEALAKISVIGNGEISQHLRTVSLGKKYEIGKACLFGIFKSKPFKIEVTWDGRIYFVGEQSEALTTVLRDVIETCLRQTGTLRLVNV